MSEWELASFGLSREGSSTTIASVCPLVGNEGAGGGGEVGQVGHRVVPIGDVRDIG